MIHATILIKVYFFLCQSRRRCDVSAWSVWVSDVCRSYGFCNVSSIWCIPAGKLHTYSCNLSCDRSEIFCSFGYF